MAVYQPKDITGKRYGKLVVLQRTNEQNKSGAYKWLCKCDCGNYVTVCIGNLRENGGTQSCGCSKSNALPLEEYESKKIKELKTITDKWEYVRCLNRGKGTHLVRCCNCGAEKTVKGLHNITDCVACLRTQKKQLEEQSKYKECVICGAMFKPQRSTALYCSERCSKVAYRQRHIDTVRERQRTNKRLREARATHNGKVDYSITLARLIERDNHICQLCGREVDESDYVYQGDIFIAGNDYPSIDHIKPLSKGGVHQWNNVQLAHRLCNSIKCDKEK